MPLEGTTENVAGSSSTGGVTSGTASDAMIRAAAAASSAETEAGSGSGTAATSTEGAGAGTSGGSTTVSPTGTGERGPIPYDRHETILANARKEYEWAERLKSEGYGPEDVQAAVTLLRQIRGDARGFWKQLGDELGAAGEGETKPRVEDLKFPEPDLVSQDGRTKAFSDAAVLKIVEIAEKRIQQQLEGKIGPLVEFYGNEMSAREAQQRDEQAKAISNAAIKRISSFPHFEALKGDIGKRLVEMHKDGTVREVGPISAMFLAYNQLVQERGPSLQNTAETKVRESMERKAAASAGSVVPGGGAGEVKKPTLNTPSDLARHMERLAATMTTA